MPFSAELRVPSGGKCLESLSQSEAIRTAIALASEWNGELRIDVLPQLLLTNVYGDKYLQEKGEIPLWKRHPTECLLVGKDISNPKYRPLIGEWNLPFLQWLKGISTATKEKFIINYEHERGDTPYEYAYWVCSPTSETEPCETFGLSNHGGMEEAEWEFEIRRFLDGRSEFRGSDLYDDGTLIFHTVSGTIRT